MAQTAKAQEPSMEEILASIRRIIADDESKARLPDPAKPEPPAARPQPAAPPPKAPEPAAVRTPAPPPSAASQDESDAMLSGMDAAAARASSNGKASDEEVADVLDLTQPMIASAPEPPVFRPSESQDVFFSKEPEPPPPPPRIEERRRPFRAPESPLMSSSTSAAVDAAFNALAHTALTQNTRTLEDLVTDMMRPMLKAWLDDNLPGLVERVVRAEIERVSRGRSQQMPAQHRREPGSSGTGR
jgi:uncharacterized protein